MFRRLGSFLVLALAAVAVAHADVKSVGGGGGTAANPAAPDGSLQFNNGGTSFGGISPSETGLHLVNWATLSGAPNLVSFTSSAIIGTFTGCTGTLLLGADGACHAGGASSFDQITSGTNTTGAFVMGSGSSLTATGTGTIAATTAEQLAATPTTCTAPQVPIGVDASGNAVGCFNPTGTGTVTTSGSPGAGQLAVFSGSTVIGGTAVGSSTLVGNNGSGVAALSPSQVQALLVAANAVTYSPTLASGATNDWDPSAAAGITTVGFVYATPNAAGSTVNGILAGSDKQQFVLCNAAALGTSNSWIILENQSASETTAANRLMGPANGVLGPQACITLTYVAGTVNRWLMGRVADAGLTAVDTLGSGTSATPDCSFGLVKVTGSAAGAFTINAPTDCSARDGQKFTLKIVSPAGGTLTYSWNAAYLASATLSLPTASNAASKEDYFAFQYDSDKSGWVFLADNQGF